MSNFNSAEITRKITRFFKEWDNRSATAEEFKDFFNKFLARECIKADVLLSHGVNMFYSHLLLKNGAEGMRWLKYVDMLTESRIIDGVVRLCQFEEYDEAWIAFKENPVVDRRALELALSHYSAIEIPRTHLLFLRKIGMLDFSDKDSFMAECLVGSVCARKDIASAKILVEMGLPASACRSMLLRMTTFVSRNDDDARYFVSNGAKVEDCWYEAVFHALWGEGYFMLNFLLETSELEIDEMKSLLQAHHPNENNWQQELWDEYEKKYKMYNRDEEKIAV